MGKIGMSGPCQTQGRSNGINDNLNKVSKLKLVVVFRWTYTIDVKIPGIGQTIMILFSSSAAWKSSAILSQERERNNIGKHHSLNTTSSSPF